MSIIDDDLGSFCPIEPLYAQEPQSSEWLKWAALQIQSPFYSISGFTFRSFVSARYSEENLRVYVYGVMALGTMGLALSAVPAIAGAGLYWASDIASGKPFTYQKGTGQEILPSKEMKMMTLNACMFPGGLPFVLGGMTPASERMGKLEGLIRKQNPDVLVMQEMAHGPSVELYDRIKDLYPHFFIRIGPNPPLMESGLFVASKYPIQNAGFIPYDDQRSILRGAFWIDTPNAVIFTSHMESGDDKNEMRASQLRKVKDVMATFDKPCFLLGDLNVNRYVERHYEECRIAEDFHDPIPKKTPTCSTKLEAVMRGTKIPAQTDEQDDYALLRKAGHENFDLSVEIIDTYNEDRPHDAISDHKALILMAKKLVKD